MKRQKLRKTILLGSMLLFPATLNYFSPYLIVQGSFEGVLAGNGVLFAGLFLSSVFFGRAFCGWMCPAGALQEVCAGIVDKPTGHRQNRIKYILWVPWLAAILLGFISAGGMQRINLIYYTDYGISVSAPAGYVIYFFVVLSIVVLSLAFGRRSFCHCVCWMAPFMMIGSWIKERLPVPSLRLKANPHQCINCKSCDNICPMSLPVSDMVGRNDPFHRECILCGNCVDVCPSKVICIGIYSKQTQPVKIEEQS